VQIRSRLVRLAACAGFAFLPLLAQTKLLRFPDIHGDKVVFTYAGDLWTASANGGTATRLTAHPGEELFAKFSPDGNWIAFTGQYDGDEQVYVMPATGGEPRQLTFYPVQVPPLVTRRGWDNQVYGWTNDGKRIIFRSLRDSWTTSISRLYTVAVGGGPAEPLPMPESGAGSFSPAGNKIVYSPEARDFRSEKRYSGGEANKLYIFDVETHEAIKIADDLRANRDPMWIGNKIYFNSDRDGHFNLYSYDVGSGKVTQVTHSKQWDVRWPNSDRQSRIVYELNGELQVLDLKSGEAKPISINVPYDGVARRPSRVSAAGLIEQASLSPKGERVLFAARGDIFSAPVEKGPTRNLTMTPGAHDKWPRWSPDGSKVAFISDKSGEEEIWVVAQDGASPPEQLTTGGKAMRYAPEWSADGKRIAFSDKDGGLWALSVPDKKLVAITKSSHGRITDYAWSPRSEFLAYSVNHPNGFHSIYIWNQADGQARELTDEMFDAWNPVWDPKGDYLYFLSNHEFAPLISNIEFNYALTRSTGIFALALRKDVKHPFPPESDEVAIAKDDTPGAEKDAAKDPAKDPAKDKDKDQDKDKGNGKDNKKPLAIDFDGLGSRVARVPLDSANYSGLAVRDGYLLYRTTPPAYYGRDAETRPELRIYSIKDRKETVLAEDASEFRISEDGSKVLVRQQQPRQPTAWLVMDATPTGGSSKKTVSTAGLMVDRVPAEEWPEIFNEVWRRYRDFFYVPNMHGYDWEALREQYRPWLPYVGDRSDLNYLISEMISELTVQHAYIAGGDITLPPRPRVALPGARFELDQASNRYKISKIFEGQNEEEIYRAPLTEIGVNINVGDYVLAINGRDLSGAEDVYRLLRNAADNPVQLLVNDKPATEGARIVSYRPVTDENKLIYLDWVNRNRKEVSELSGGKIGYLHVPDMGADGISEFIKWYYPQIKKEGLIIDDRANGGGNVSRLLIERLRRKPLAADFSRTQEDPGLYPDGTFIGPMTVLLDENSGSDGDIFPAMFREAGLGPLIGKRSWGGAVGITNHGMLIDGGEVNVPEFGYADLKGDWIIEGHGVDPDIEVDNDPKSVIEGHDPQLERAVAEMLKRLKEKPVQWPQRPADPVKLK
jgi:tricorn protease